MKNEHEDVRALHINFGQYTSLGELFAVKHTANKLNIPMESVNVEGVMNMLVGFYPPNLLNVLEYDIGRGPDEGPGPDDLDTEPLMNKNTISGFHVLVSLATHYVQLSKYDKLNVGVLKEQVEDRKGFIKFVEGWNKSVSFLNEESDFELTTPFINKYKKDIVTLGKELKVNMSTTWSCYRNGPVHCGSCSGCLERRKAFYEAGIK